MGETSEALLKRLDKATEPWKEDIQRKKMFGGTCYLYKGKMTIGETKERLVVRVVSSKMDEVLNKPFVEVMDFTGKPMKEFVFVQPGGFETEEDLQYWIELGIEHAKKSLE